LKYREIYEQREREEAERIAQSKSKKGKKKKGVLLSSNIKIGSPNMKNKSKI
tara:strand:- start:672 stop:827 length:156 start_codon:yes stop_codon:yes gene_type:complete